MLYKILNAPVNLACALYLRAYAAVTNKYIDVKLNEAARSLEKQMREAITENKRQILFAERLLIDESRTNPETLETKVN